MLVFNGALGLALFAFWLFCLIDVIMTDASLCRNLQKGFWVLIVLLLFDIGAIIWLIAGRPWPQNASRNHFPSGNTGTAYTEYDRPGRFVAKDRESDEEFLRRCRERAEEQRKRYRDQQSSGEEDPTAP